MVRLDIRAQLAGFFRLSQNDLEIDSRSVVAAEKEAYTSRRAADTNTDGKITYSEYLDHLNKVTPSSVSKYDLTLSRVLPVLKDFSFSLTGGMVGTGILTTDLTLPGNIFLTAGTKISILADGLLVSNIEEVNTDKYKVTVGAANVALLPFNTVSGNPGFFSVFPQACREDVLARTTGLASANTVIQIVLAETLQWFQDNPPAADGSNFAARRERSLLLDQLGHDIPQEVWSDYYFDWDRKGLKTF